MKCNQTLKNNLWYKIPVESKSLEFYEENFNYFFGWGFPLLIYDVRISWTLIFKFFAGVSLMSSRDTSKTWFFLRIIDLLLSFFKYLLNFLLFTTFNTQGMGAHQKWNKPTKIKKNKTMKDKNLTFWLYKRKHFRSTK